jgi:hypothetical protein
MEFNSMNKQEIQDKLLELYQVNIVPMYPKLEYIEFIPSLYYKNKKGFVVCFHSCCLKTNRQIKLLHHDDIKYIYLLSLKLEHILNNKLKSVLNQLTLSDFNEWGNNLWKISKTECDIGV